jgi:hypothetical protein
MIRTYIYTVTVSYFNKFEIIGYAALPDNCDVIAKTGRRDTTFTFVYMMYAHISFVNKIYGKCYVKVLI